MTVKSNRRNFLKYSAAVIGGAQGVNASKYRASNSQAKAKSIIYIYLGGGLSQLDSFDIKADNKEVSGISRAIKTSAHGLQVSHFFPKMARQMHHVAVVNSMSTTQGAHVEGKYYTRTSYVPRSSVLHPELGAWVSKHKKRGSKTLPSFVKISGSASSGAGFFDGKYGALPIGEPESGLKYSSRFKNVDKQTYDKRLDLLKRFNNNYSRTNTQKMVQTYSDTYRSALELMESKDLDVFSIQKEKKQTLEFYGNNSFGQGCLLARRLAESGVNFIEVNSNAWDHHNSLYEDFTPKAKELDQGLAALLQDLSQRGMLDTTMVVLATEFGRAPHFSLGKGRGHYPKAYSCLLAGGGIKGGQSYGKTSADGREIESGKVSVPDFNATIAYAAGLNLKHVETSPEGRPFTVAHKGKPLLKLF